MGSTVSKLFLDFFYIYKVPNKPIARKQTNYRPRDSNDRSMKTRLDTMDIL